LRRSLVSLALMFGVVALTGCGTTGGRSGASVAPASPPGTGSGEPSTSGPATTSPSATSGSPAPSSDTVEPAFTPVPDASQAPDTGGGAAAGDIPDNAVFLTYTSAAWQFVVQYIEGWQVTTQPDGVVIRDKDSSETIAVTQKPPNLDAWVTSKDLPALQAQPGFKLVKRNHARVGSATLLHLVYHVLSAPDPVTGKQVPSTVDRFYLPGPGLAIISLATPDGVDNVDAFRQIIGSFKWKAR
jgi:hypothetical protein